MNDKMTPAELATALKHVLSAIDDIAAEMNDESIACKCCGLVKRTNFDDHQAKQALEGAYGRLVKLYEKLMAGEWQGREMAPVAQASELRGK